MLFINIIHLVRFGAPCIGACNKYRYGTLEHQAIALAPSEDYDRDGCSQDLQLVTIINISVLHGPHLVIR